MYLSIAESEDSHFLCTFKDITSRLCRTVPSPHASPRSHYNITAGISDTTTMTGASYGSIAQQEAHQWRIEIDNGSDRYPSWRKTNIPVLAAAFLAALATGGPTYAFGLYGSTLKATLHLTQTQLDTVSSANFCAGLLSWIPGMCVDRWGPKRAMMMGGTLSCLSLLAYWVVARQFVSVSHHLIVPALSVLGVFIFMSNALVIGSIYKVILLCCGPGAKGTAVGVAKAYVGLGAGAYTCLFTTIQRHDETDLDFLPMAAFFAFVTVTIPAIVFLPSNEEMTQHPFVDGMTPLHYRTVYSGLLALGLLVMGTSARSLFQPIPDDDDYETSLTLASSSGEKEGGPEFYRALLLLTAWFGPILALLFLPLRLEQSVSPKIESEINEEPEVVMPLVSAEALVGIVHKRANPVDLNLVQMLQTVPAWLLLWTCTILVGSGTMMTNSKSKRRLCLVLLDTGARLSLTFD
jgi:MFS family permease